MDRADLWRMIGFVPQKAFLFSGTVASNLRYGDENADEAALWQALEMAQGREFVTEMEEGLEAPISQGGANVSGGQRQRLSVARALVKRAPIYVLDDSFSALDFKTDSLLRAALKRETADATVFIVAQRVSTIMHADQIIVLDEGTIVGMGTHEELMRPARPIRRSSTRSSPRRKWHERAGEKGKRRSRSGAAARWSGVRSRPHDGATRGEAPRFQGVVPAAGRPATPGTRHDVAGRGALCGQRHLQYRRAEDPGPGHQPHLRGGHKRANCRRA